MKRSYRNLSFLGILLLSSSVFSQITGRVNDALGFPQADAEIKIKGSQQLFYTDENGDFSIDVPLGTTLIIHEKEYIVNSTQLGTLDPRKEENITLEGVVVTSIFEAPQSAGTTTVKGEDFKNLNPSSSVDQLLAGKVSGLSSQAQNGRSREQCQCRYPWRHWFKWRCQKPAVCCGRNLSYRQRYRRYKSQ